MTQFVKIGRVADCPPGARLAYDFEYESVIVVNVGGTFFAVADRCTHDDGPLGDGEIDAPACVIVCPRHGARFNLKTGAATFPAVEPVPTYELKIEAGEIYVAAPEDD